MSSNRNYSNNYNKYRRTSNYPYRQGQSGYKSNTISKRASNNLKAAFEQRDQAEVVLNCNQILACQLQTPDSDGNYAVGALNVFDALIHSEFFGNYAPMYDQVRIDKVKAKFTSLQYPKQEGNNTTSNFSIVTAFDRNGLDEGQILAGGAGGVTGNDIVYGTTIGKNIATYSSALTKNLTFGNAFDIIRYISPSSMQEKGQFIATDSLKQWYEKYDYERNQYNTGTPENNVPPYYNKWTKNAVAKNPCYLEKCEAIPFKPTYLIGVIGLSTLRGNVIFNVELDVCCTFRGLRKSLTMGENNRNVEKVYVVRKEFLKSNGRTENFIVQDEFSVVDGVSVEDRQVTFAVDVEGDVLDNNIVCKPVYISNNEVITSGSRDVNDMDIVESTNNDLSTVNDVNMGILESGTNVVFDKIDNVLSLHKIGVECICLSPEVLSDTEMESVYSKLNSDDFNSGDEVVIERKVNGFNVNIVEIKRTLTRGQYIAKYGNRNVPVIGSDGIVDTIKVYVLKIKDFTSITVGGKYKVNGNGKYVVVRLDGTVEVFDFGEDQNVNSVPSYIEFQKDDMYFFISVDIDNNVIKESICNFAINKKGKIVFKGFGYRYETNIKELGRLLCTAISWISRKLFSANPDREFNEDDNNNPIQLISDESEENNYDPPVYPGEIEYSPWSNENN